MRPDESPWIKTAERQPTEEEMPVIVRDDITVDICHHRASVGNPNEWPLWMSIPKVTEPIPTIQRTSVLAVTAFALKVNDGKWHSGDIPTTAIAFSRAAAEAWVKSEHNRFYEEKPVWTCSDEEFHALCHDVPETQGVEAFCAGCEKYQMKTFGRSPIAEMREALAAFHNTHDLVFQSSPELRKIGEQESTEAQPLKPARELKARILETIEEWANRERRIFGILKK